MRRKIFLLIVVAFVFLNLFAVSAEDNGTVIDDVSVVNETVDSPVSIEVPSIYATVPPGKNIDVSPNPSIDPYWLFGYVEKDFNTTDLVKVYKNDSQFIVDARDTPYENITFKVNGVSYVRQVNESGFAKLNINLNPGVYTIESSSQNYSVNNTITVLPTLIGDNLVKYYRNDSQFYVKLVDSSSNPVASKNVTFNINGVFYSRQTNDEGIARLNINLEPGEYVITATDPLTGLKMSYNITVLPKMYAEDVVASYGDTYYYTVKLVDDMGCALPGKTVNFNIGGLLFNSITDSDGLVKVCIGLMPGKYIVTAEYMSSKISNSIVILDE